jgi:hypothetical protein
MDNSLACRSELASGGKGVGKFIKFTSYLINTSSGKVTTGCEETILL